LLLGLSLTLFVVYFMQTSCYFLWTQQMFPNTYPMSVNDLYFGYINLLEFLVFILVRTRMTIKYLPKIITIHNVCFIFYINSYPYAAMY